ncbi:MAG: segregation/condensation protein A [Eubacterium sp.]|nr:segregation/condensation protein A [Eubacterium sp.]MCR5292240.1 segregation/condensation protein A [Eubacterium sp.]
MSVVDIKIEKFEGPLDLLLHLIDKNKFNIFDIPIVEITEQYMEYLDKLTEADVDKLSDFLVMAATLISIKAKMLLPEPESEETEEDDPRAELVRALIEYKMYKYASLELKDMELDAEKMLYKQETIPDEVKSFKEEVDPAEVIGDTTLAKLNEIFLQIMKRENDKIDPVRSKFGNITKDEIRVEDKMAEIRSSLKGLKSINFRTLLEKERGKMNIIVSFLAVLELIKNGAVAVRQEEIFGDIVLDSLE